MTQRWNWVVRSKPETGFSYIEFASSEWALAYADGLERPCQVLERTIDGYIDHTATFYAAKALKMTAEGEPMTVTELMDKAMAEARQNKIPPQ